MNSARGVRRALVAALAATALLVVAARPGSAQSAQAIQPSALHEIQAILQEKLKRTPAQRKLGSHLHHAALVVGGALTTAAMPSLTSAFAAVELDGGGNVHVDIQGVVTPSLLAEIAALGGTVESSVPEYGAIRAWMPLSRAETLAARADVAFIKPAEQGTTNTRPIDTKALISHAADLVLDAGVFNGSGVKVGVLSDGVKSLATLQAANNLPAVTILPGQAGLPSRDEGTAMLEIVYDLAPGAQLLFATAATGAAQFAANIQSLAAAGASIIVDDFTYYTEGAFQDDLIAQAVDAVTANGVLYLSSAGNSGNLDAGTSGTWEGDFVDSGTTIPVLGGAGAIHAFDAVHNYNPVTVASNVGGWTTLKWSDPLHASCNDYDLFILDSTMSTIVSSSTNVQACGQEPIEYVAAPAAGQRIVVVLASGSPRALNVATNRGRLAIHTDGATYGHNAGANTLTVAATPAQGSIFTSDNQSPEAYSSDGPRTIFYYSDGSAITPGNFLFGTGGGVTLPKVDFTAADCGQGAVPGFSTFCGTSAAAPAAAAIAALAKSAAPAVTATGLADILRNTALPASSAFNARTVGSGIVMADAAVNGALQCRAQTRDFNGDCHGDVLWRDGAGNLAMWFMSGGSTFLGAFVSNVSMAYTVVGIGDFNGDGYADILWRDGSGNLSMWLMRSHRMLSGASLGNVPTSWTPVRIGDFNGDGKADILWRNGIGDVAIWFMNGPNVASNVFITNVPTSWTPVAVGDFNADGKTDIVWRDTNGDLAIWFMNGANVTGAFVTNVSTAFTVAGVGDFNGDGKADILWRDDAGNLSMWWMNGAQIAGGNTLGNVPTTWTPVRIGDFNGDGRADILWRNSNGDVAVWYMSGFSVLSNDFVTNVATGWSTP